MNFENILKERFGLESFREWQLDIIKSVVEKNDTLVFMPTGWGKSLIYQFSWMILEGVVIVISPLISLMKDQVDKLNELWIRAELINSTINSTHKKLILHELENTDFTEINPIKFLYIAPERLNDEEFLRVVKNTKIALIAIDEAHCISQWGHDFRPSYLKIKDFIGELRSVWKTKWELFPIVALTATATKKVRADIVERLWITENRVFTKWFDRKNLIYIVREITKEKEKLEKVLDIIQKTPPFWIVYCSSVKNVSKVYQYLLENWVRVWIYTWEMQPNLRENEQNNFMTWVYDIIVATNAFWMWIDKKDVRYVIHYNLPWSIENYYQEAGRAWRDWKNSYSIVIASYQDTIIQEFFIENIHPQKETVLKLYDFLYKDFQIGAWNWHQILQTYAQIASNAWLQSGMQVWTILKLFEKYNIVKRWFEAEDSDDFRGKWITLLSPKTTYDKIPILWHHQATLKQESYFKLEQVKKLLFKPGCRKKFILEYFQDEEDLALLTDNCGVCDYCIDKKNFANSPDKQMIPYTVFLILLEFVKRLDEKFWVNVLVWILVWSKEKKLIDWNLDLDKDYGILSIYSTDFVKAMIESLYENGFLYKSMWEYPKIWISHKGIDSIFNNKVLIAEDENLQTSIMMKTRNAPKYALEQMEKKHTTRKIKVEKVDKIDTYTQTLNLLETGITLDEIAKNREVTLQTIESHLVKLYEYDKISLSKIMQYSSLETLKEIKNTINSKNLEIDKLSTIKENLSSKISYFEIKIALAMMWKGDL